jgi:hypothetical protein
MGITPPDKIARWIKAAGQTGKAQPVLDRVVTGGTQYIVHDKFAMKEI